jgi:RHS repeat-associated protein
LRTGNVQRGLSRATQERVQQNREDSMHHLTRFISRTARCALGAAAVAAALTSGFAQAQGTGGGASGGSCTAPPGGNPGSNDCSGSGSSPAALGRSGPDVGAGNPIHLLSGNKYQQEIDLPALPGVLGIEVIRHYNSLDAHRGLTGANWRLSYEAVLYDFGRNLQIVQADGRRLMFERPAKAGRPATSELCSAADAADGHVTVEYDAQQQPTYHWRWPNGRVLTFGWGTAGGHPLHSIAAASGERLVLAYAPTGELLRITDPQGRSLTLDYDRQRQLQSIITPLGTVRYLRDALYRLVEARSDGNAQAGVTRRYHYESERQSNHANALTGISLISNDAQGKRNEQRLSTYAYNTRGRAILSTKGRPKDTRNGQPVADTGIEQVDIDYQEPALPNKTQVRDGIAVPAQLGTTILTNSLGQRSQIKTAVIAGNFRLIEFTGPGCATCPEANKRYAYNARGQLVREHALDVDGRIMVTRHHEHDAQGRTVREGVQVDAATPVQWTQRLEYNDARFPLQATLLARPSVVEGKEHHTHIAYNDKGQVTQVIERGLSPVDTNGQPSPQGTPISRTTTYAYTTVQGKSVLATIDGPLSNGPKQSPEDSDITHLEWNEQGTQITAVTAPMNLVTRHERDDAGRLRVTRADSGSVSRWYYRAEQPQRPSATVRAGIATGYAYDAQGRVAAVADASGRFITLQYDAAGRLTSVRDAQGYTQTLQLDAEGKPLVAGLYEPGRDHPLRAAYRVYDEQQRLKASILPDGRVSTWRYDDSAQGQGRLVEHIDGDDVLHLWRSSTAQNASAQIDITPDGLVRASLQSPRAAALASNAGAPTRIKDDFGRTVAQRTPDHGTRFMVHDAADRVVLSRQLGTDAKLASTTEQDHDAAGRLTERRVLDAQGQVIDRVSWRWQGTQLRQVDDTAQTQTFERDSAGRVIRTLVTLKTPEGKPLAPITLRTSYDPLTGEPLAHTLADERELRIERDAVTGIARQLTLASPAQWWQLWKTQWSLRAALQGELQDRTVLQDISAHPFNGVSRWRHGNGVATAKQFDIAGRLTQLNVGAPNNAISAQTLAYQTGPRVRGISDDATQQRSAFDYNGFGLLKTYTGSAKPALQRTALTTTATAQRASPQAIEYDSLGRIALEGSHRYRYNASGQLSEVREQDRVVARYRYNHLGQRVSKTVFDQGKPSTTYFLWHQQRLVAELSGDGHGALRIDTQYLYLKDGHKAATPIAKLEAATASGNTTGKARLLAVHADHRGQPIAMSDEQQRVVWRSPAGVHANAWGYASTAAEERTSTQQAEMNLSLPGQYRDAETGLHDNWHRTYDPKTGRYLQPDPLGYPDGPDPYLYAGGDPVNKVDPTGLYEEDVHYYMTLFLALAAGMDLQQAQTTALATQFVDDNPLTRPVDSTTTGSTVASMLRNHQQVLLYHFTLSDETGRTLQRYRNSNVNAVVNNLSPQLQNLMNASNRAPTPCARYQLLGEFLHAYEDTFTHRDEGDIPYNAMTLGTGLGHGLAGHEPDFTYNGERFWTNREARTLAMERAVFAQLQRYGSGQGVAFADIESTLMGFNAIRESGPGATTKIQLLQDEINRLLGNLQITPRDTQGNVVARVSLTARRDAEGAVGLGYNRGRARENRNNYLRGLREEEYPGVCLEGGTRCRPV